MTLVQIATPIATIGFSGMAIFQLLLALGLPLGKAAWGGKYRIVPSRLRIASLISAVIFIIGVLVVLEKSGFITIFNSPNFVGYTIWGLTVLFGFSAASNLASTSKLEKRIMTPVALILFFSCLILVVFR
jgi:hypothetical protein